MNKKTRLHITTAALLCMIAITGCGKPSPSTSPESTAQASAPSLPAGLLSSSPLEGALSVVEARGQVEANASIVLTGYIGGREEPLAKERAILTLADAKAMIRCDADPGDACTTPWDACCVSPEIMKASIASIQVLDASGDVIKQSLNGFGGIEPGSTITVQGTIDPTSSSSVLIVNAEKIHVSAHP